MSCENCTKKLKEIEEIEKDLAKLRGNLHKSLARIDEEIKKLQVTQRKQIENALIAFDLEGTIKKQLKEYNNDYFNIMLTPGMKKEEKHKHERKDGEMNRYY